MQSTSGTTALFTITPGKEYTVTVVAHNGGGWGPGRSASIDTTLPKAPGKFKVVGGVRSADLTWNPPTPPSPVTDYTVTATPTTGSPSTVPVSVFRPDLSGHGVWSDTEHGVHIHGDCHECVR